MKTLIRSPTRNPDFDTEGEVSTNDEYQKFLVVFDGMLKKQKMHLSFHHA